MNYYNYHIGDYRTATAHLNLEEDATYKRLIDYQYDKECPIPNDMPLMARRLRSTETLIESMLKEFFTLTEEGWINKRVFEEVQNHQEFIQKQKHNGRKGGKQTHRLPNAYPPPTLPITNTQLPITNKESDVDFSELPESLNTPEFKETWIKFIQYRKERKKPLYPTSFLAKWKQMEAWGVANAINAINNSIANGWQGIFPVDQQEAKKQKTEQESKYRNIF